MYTTKFTVTAPAERLFPLDMLRHDRCYPIEGLADMAASFSLMNALGAMAAGGTREVKLQMQSCDMFYAVPTVERWSSFGWIVTGVVTTGTGN